MTQQEINEANKDYTTPEQSKRLLELGVPAKSANMYYYDMGSGFIYAPDMIESKRDSDDLVSGDPRSLPCWTTGRLMYIINMCVPQAYSRMLIFMSMNLHKIADFIEMCLTVYEVLVEKDMIDFNRLEDVL